MRYPKIYARSKPADIAWQQCRPVEYLGAGKVLVEFKSGARHVVDPFALRDVGYEKRRMQVDSVLNRWSTWPGT